MPEIKNVNDLAGKIDSLRPDQQQGVQGGKFQGSNASAVQPPVESPVAGQLNAKRAEPPAESPLKPGEPTSEQLFDYATGNNKSDAVGKYLEQDPAASKAVSAIKRGHDEI